MNHDTDYWSIYFFLGVNSEGIEFEPEYYFHADIIGYDLITAPFKDSGHWLKLAIVDPHSGLGIGSSLAYGFNLSNSEKVCGTFFPLELYYTLSSHLRDCIWGKTVRLLQIYLSASCWGGVFVEQPDKFPDYQLFKNGKLMDIGVSHTDGILWTLKAGYAVASGIDYYLKPFSESHLYAALQLQLGGWIVKEKQAQLKETASAKVEPLPVDSLRVTKREYPDIDTIQPRESIAARIESLYIDSLVQKRVSQVENLYVDSLVFGKCGKKEFYETVNLIAGNIEKHFADDPDFVSIKEVLFELVTDKRATAEHKQNQYTRGGCVIGGLAASLGWYRILLEMHEDISGPGGEPDAACCLGVIYLSAIAATPFVIAGGASIGAVTGVILSEEGVSEFDLLKLNTIIDKYNKRVTEKYILNR